MCVWDVQWCPGKSLKLFLNYTSCKLISLQLNFDKQLGIGTGSSSWGWAAASWLFFVSILHLSVYCVWPFLWISWEAKAPMPACELTLWFCKHLYKQLNPTYLTGLLIEYLQGFDFSVNWLHWRPCSIFYTLKARLALKLKKYIFSPCLNSPSIYLLPFKRGEKAGCIIRVRVEKQSWLTSMTSSPSLALLYCHGQSDCLEAPQKFRYGTSASKIQICKRENPEGFFLKSDSAACPLQERAESRDSVPSSYEYLLTLGIHRSCFRKPR